MRRFKARVIRNIGTETAWLQKNPILGDGEQALVRFGGRVRSKIGNGSLTFSQLSYQDNDMKVSAATPSFPFQSGEGPAPAGVYMADGSGIYNGTLNVDTTGKIVMLVWDGVNTLESVDTILPMPALVNDTNSSSASSALAANIGRLLKLRGQAEKWEIYSPATYTYDRTAGTLSQTGTLGIKLDNGSSLLITAFTDLQVVATGTMVNGISNLYVDFDTPTTASNITVSIQVANKNAMPALADSKTRIILGKSILITGTNADLTSDRLGWFWGITGNKTPFQIVKETADVASVSATNNSSNILKLKNDLQSSEGYISGTNDWTWDSTTGTLNAPTSKRYVNSNGVSGYLVTTEGALNFLPKNFQAVPPDANADIVYVIYADFDIPLTGTLFYLKTEKMNNLSPAAIGKQRMVLGYAKKITSIQYDFESDISQFYKASGNRKKPIQLAIEAASNPQPPVMTNRQKVDTAFYNKFPLALSKCPKFIQKLLLQKEDVYVIALSDSLLGLQSGCSNSPSHPQNLPNGCYQMHVQYWLWYFYVKNKPLTNRWEVTPNIFTYVGTWAILGSGAGSKFDSPAWAGEFRSYIATIHMSNSANASIAFTWNLAAYEKLNWIYKKTLDGASDVTLTIAEGNGHVQLFDGDSWIEANGYVFSQKTANRPQGDGYALHLSDCKIKMRRVVNVGTITITFSKGASTSEYLYFWGTERWNGAAVFITNVARGGRYFSLLKDNFLNDVVERKPDLVLFSLPMTNEYSNFSQTGYAQIIDHAQDFIWGDRPGHETQLSLKYQSNNWQNFECLLILPHYRQHYFKGDIPANYKLSGSNLDIITYDGDSTPYATNQKIKALINSKGDLNYIDIGEVFIEMSKVLGWTTEQATTPSGITSENSFTNDTVHQNDFGAWLWAKVLVSVLTV